MNSNIRYASSELVRYYCENRNTWDRLYQSEKVIFTSEESLGVVLDVGCACGGLLSALSEKKLLDGYTGVDINQEMIEWAVMNQVGDIPFRFIYGDVLEVDFEGSFDTVISLSCADWNVETNNILDKCWSLVKPGGNFIVSLRLTNQDTINDIENSYQFIDFSGIGENKERANYVVFNWQEGIRMLCNLAPRPCKIQAYGYWGNPSQTAITKYNDLVFAVLRVHKPATTANSLTQLMLDFPADLLI